MIKVRRAEVTDVPYILRELRKFAAFFGTKLSLFPEDEEVAFGVIQSMIENHFFLLATDGPKQLGFISGFVTPHPFNPGITQLTETFWWVGEEHRRTSAGSALLNAFVEWGKDHVDWVTMTLEAESPVSSFPLLKRGFKFKEQSFILETGLRATPGGLPSPP